MHSLVTLFLIIVYFANCQQQSTTIGYQSHSFDDIREWKQLIIKGSFFFKIDGHYLPSWFCQMIPRLFNQKPLNDPRGCLLLTHDPPIFSEIAYFSSYDIETFLEDPANRPLFISNNRILLYFHNIVDSDFYPPLDFNAVNELQIEWVLNTSSLVKKLDLNVQIICESVSSLPQVYGANSADLTNKSSCFYSNEGECETYQVLNNPANPIPLEDPTQYVIQLCPYGFGKFADSEYPWVYWEPTDQITMWRLFDAYLKCGIEHSPGFLIATNTDPIHYNVHAGTRSGLAWNQQLIENAGNPFIVLLASESFISMLIIYSLGDQLLYKILRSDEIWAPIDESSPEIFPASLEVISTLDYCIDSDLILVGDVNGNINLIKIQNETLELLSTTKLQPNNFNLKFIDSETILQVFQSKSSICLQFFTLSGNEIEPEGIPSCSKEEINAFNCSLDFIPNSNSFSCNGTHFGVLVCSTFDMEIIGASVCIDSLSNTAFFSNFSQFDVGSNPTISIYQQNETSIFFLETHTDGFCYNCDWHNKRAIPMLCDNQPISCPRILNYNFGEISDFVEHLLGNKGNITSCDDSIIHGDYDQGSNPRSILLQYKNQMVVIETHVGVSNVSVDVCGCGYPVPFDGLMIDGFSLPSLDRMKIPSTFSKGKTIESDFTLPLLIGNECETCEADLWKLQYIIEHDYDILEKEIEELIKGCFIDDFIVGGTLYDCKNLIELYGNEIFEEEVQTVFSPSNCVDLGYCNSTK